VEIAAVTGGVPVFPTIGGIGTAEPRRITYRGTWLAGLIAQAFGVRPDQISGPAWLSTTRYDIVANIPEGATRAQVNAMLANLLRDRFGLRFHFESKVQPAYALRVGKGGAKFKPAAPSANTAAASSGSIGGPDERGCPTTVPADYKGMGGWPTPGGMCWTARDVPLQTLAIALERPAGRPIVDETGLTGGYDFTIYFAQVGRRSGSPEVASSAPSVFSAVEEQLGLKLEPTNAPFDQFIIDSIERDPTEN
jgi:uncharacterized protein (TIGR03435 family)